MEFPVKEYLLIRRARYGDLNAFIQLYDAYVERVYRYIHFLTPNDGVAEGLTFKVFFKAWEQLGDLRIIDLSLPVRLFSIARDQLMNYHRTHKKAAAPDSDLALARQGR